MLERGAVLSHAAIVARELGVPAVLGVARATELLDGCLVRVDGDHGTVSILEPAPAALAGRAPAASSLGPEAVR